MPIKVLSKQRFGGRNFNFSETTPAIPIITANLILNLDASNSSSYPGSGTTWTDLTGNGYNGTLLNGPTYSSANSGSIVFDGTNDEVRTSMVSNARTNVTMSGWFYVNLGTYGTFLNNGDDAGGYAIGIGTNFGTADNQVTALFGTIRWIPTGVYYQYTGWHMITMVLNSSGTPLIYINGNLIGTYSGTISNVPSPGTGLSIGSQRGFRYANTRSGSVNFYSGALSAAEILQNFYSLKNRYGI